MTDKVKFVIPGELYSSKNSKGVIAGGITKNGKVRRIPISSKAARRQAQQFAALLESNPGFKITWLNETALHEMPYRMQIKIFRGRAGRFDYNNIVQNLFDAMVKAELLPDDDADTLIPVYVPYEIDRKNPRTEIVFL